MKYVFDKNGIVNSENTERLVQYSVNANELQVAFTDLNIKEYVPYVAFERADGKVSPLIGMAFTDFELNGTKYSGASYSFSDSWVTAQSGILKVAIILKKNNVNARTSTFNLNVAESISEDKVNYIEDVAYNELVARLYVLETKFENGYVERAEKDSLGNVIHETYAEKSDVPTKTSQLINDSNYANKEEIPTTTNELVNDSGFINKMVNDLVYYYTKNEILELISQLPKFNIVRVDVLPIEDISSTTIYLILDNSSSDNENFFKEYIYINNRWELIGTTKIDLSDYTTTQQVKDIFDSLFNEKNLINQNVFNTELDKKLNKVIQLADGSFINFLINNNEFIIDHNTDNNSYQQIQFGQDFIKLSKQYKHLMIDDEGLEYQDVYNLNDDNTSISYIMTKNGHLILKITSQENGGSYKDAAKIDISKDGVVIDNLSSLDSKSIGYINSIIDFANYYNKNEILELINNISSLSMKVVNSLPVENIKTNTIYLLDKNKNSETNIYDEYIYVNNKWEVIGTTEINLSDYVKKDELPTKLSDLEDDLEVMTFERLRDEFEYTQIHNIVSAGKANLNEVNIHGNFTYKGQDISDYFGDSEAIVDVEELSLYSGVAVPNSGYVENVYFNTNLSVEEVTKLCKKLTLNSSYKYYCLIGTSNTPQIEIYNSSEGADDSFVIRDIRNGKYYWASDDAQANAYWQGTAGWNPNINYPISINKEVLSSQYGNPIATENTLIKDLFSSEPFKKANEQVLYRFSGEANGTIVPNTGYVEKVYFNTSLNVDEVVSILSKLIYTQTPFLSYPIYPILFSSDGTPVVFAVKFSVNHTVWYEINIAYDLANQVFDRIFLSYDTGDGKKAGWHKNKCEINKQVISEYSGLPIGFSNQIISQLVSITPFTPTLYHLKNGVKYELVSKDELDKTIGDINSILDTLNGEVV